MNATLLLNLVLFLALSPPPGFQPIVERNEVAVFRRAIGQGIDLYAEGDIAAPPSRVQALLLDYERAPRFVSDVAESRILSRNETTIWVYQRLDLPVLADRDFTLKVSFGTDGNTPWIRFACDNEQGPPPRKGVVRVSLHQGLWLLEPTQDGRATHARYQVRLDLAGSLPGWMARSQAAKEVPALFEGIRRQLR